MWDRSRGLLDPVGGCPSKPPLQLLLRGRRGRRGPMQIRAPELTTCSGHLQTIFSVIGNFTTVDAVTYRRTYLRVPDGGTLGLDFTPHDKDMPDDAPLVVVCHGLTGGSYESYVRNVLARVIKPKQEGGLGGRAVVINVRSLRLAKSTDILPMVARLHNASGKTDIAQLIHSTAAAPASPSPPPRFTLQAPRTTCPSPCITSAPSTLLPPCTASASRSADPSCRDTSARPAPHLCSPPASPSAPRGIFPG